MTIEDRDQWECLLADWSAAYHITQSDEADELPFKAAPHAEPGTLLAAASPRALRAKVVEDHAHRAAAAPQPGAMRTAAATRPGDTELSQAVRADREREDAS
jgi:hypothetical protein